MVFWLVLKLEISYRVLLSWRILVSFRGFLEEDYIFLHGEIFFEFPLILLLLKILFDVNGKATVWHTPLFKLRTHRKKQNHLPRSFDLLKLFGDFHIENQTDAAADALHFLTFIFKMFFLRSINWWLLAFKLWCGLPFPLFILLQTLSLSLSLSLF